MKTLLLARAAALLFTPGIAAAQSSMPRMEMKDAPQPAEPKPPVAPVKDHAGNSMPEAPAPMPDRADPDGGQESTPKPAGPSGMEETDHSDHDMAGMAGMSPNGGEIGTATAPAPPTDHAADALFDPAEMASARDALRRENGAFIGSMVLFDLAEYQARKGADGYRWEGEAWFGDDIDRLLIKSEGEGTFGKSIEDVELQALYSRAIAPFWNAQIGIRHDIVPNPSRTYAVVGIEGIAPYWFHLTGQLFLSDKGDFRARLEGSYDERITQRLIVQPRAEFNFSGQDLHDIGVGSGFSGFELGARLRYEIRKELAPYLGVEWAKKTGDTARLSRLAGEDPDMVNLVAGVRFWF